MVENCHRHDIVHVNIIRIVTPQRRGQTDRWPIDRPIDRLSISIGPKTRLAYRNNQDRKNFKEYTQAEVDVYAESTARDFGVYNCAERFPLEDSDRNFALIMAMALNDAA